MSLSIFVSIEAPDMMAGCQLFRHHSVLLVFGLYNFKVECRNIERSRHSWLVLLIFSWIAHFIAVLHNYLGATKWKQDLVRSLSAFNKNYFQVLSDRRPHTPINNSPHCWRMYFLMSVNTGFTELKLIQSMWLKLIFYLTEWKVFKM